MSDKYYKLSNDQIIPSAKAPIRAVGLKFHSVIYLRVINSNQLYIVFRLMIFLFILVEIISA